MVFYKRKERQLLAIAGHFNKEELKELKKRWLPKI